MSNINERLISRGGEPFEIKASTDDNSTAEKEIILETFTYHGEVGYFKGKTLYITGIKAVTGTGVHLEYIKLDGIVFIHQDSFNGGLNLNDNVNMYGFDTDEPNIISVYGTPIPLRIKMDLKASASTSANNLTVYLCGIMLDQDSELTL